MKIKGVSGILAGLMATVALLTTPAYAQKLVVGCVLVQQYSGAEIKMMLEQVRSSVGDAEANTLHAKYISLQNDCRSDHNASRVVYISDAMHRLLSEYGVNVRRYAVSER